MMSLWGITSLVLDKSERRPTTTWKRSSYAICWIYDIGSKAPFPSFGVEEGERLCKKVELSGSIVGDNGRKPYSVNGHVGSMEPSSGSGDCVVLVAVGRCRTIGS